jgi:predicted homoserine dehydrogenase-like protein
MMGQPVDMLGKSPRIEALDGFYDPGMERATALEKEGCVRYLIGQAVLEGVFQIGVQASFIQKFRRLKVSQAALKNIVRHFRNSLENSEGYRLADDRSHLEETPLLG